MIWRKRNTGKERKYKNEKTQVAGHWFDSKAEGALYQELLILEKAGEISGVVHHPGTVFLTEARVQYRPDFRFVRVATGEVEYAEFKGFQDQKWPIKKRLWGVYGPGKLSIYMGSHTRIRLVEVITPKGEKSK